MKTAQNHKNDSNFFSGNFFATPYGSMNAQYFQIFVLSSFIGVSQRLEVQNITQSWLIRARTPCAGWASKTYPVDFQIIRTFFLEKIFQNGFFSKSENGLAISFY